MRSIVYNIFGEPSEVLKVEERALPTPGPGEVRVRVLRTVIHNHDVTTIRGTYGHRPELPASGGTEAMGVVEARGPGVELPEGQRVAFFATGTWSEYVVLNAMGAVPLPDSISDDEGAQVLGMPLSALVLLDSLSVTSGEWVIQNAANGAVGVNLDKLADARGVKVINLVRRAAGIAELHALGIKHVVSTDQDGWKETVRSIVGEGRVAAAVDSVGGRAAGDLLDLLSQNGTITIFGRMSGEPLVIEGNSLVFKNVTIKGFWAGTALGTATPAEMGRLFGQILQLAATGALHLPTGGVFSFDEIGKAIEAGNKPGRGGKILLKP